jgi:hypothetical protein
MAEAALKHWGSQENIGKGDAIFNKPTFLGRATRFGFTSFSGVLRTGRHPRRKIHNYQPPSLDLERGSRTRTADSPYEASWWATPSPIRSRRWRRGASSTVRSACVRHHTYDPEGRELARVWPSETPMGPRGLSASRLGNVSRERPRPRPGRSKLGDF